MTNRNAATALLLTAGFCHGQMYTISTFAGGGPLATPVAAVGAPVYPSSITRDNFGAVYSTSTNCIFRVDANGSIFRFAGNGGSAAGILASRSKR